MSRFSCVAFLVILFDIISAQDCPTQGHLPWQDINPGTPDPCPPCPSPCTNIGIGYDVCCQQPVCTITGTIPQTDINGNYLQCPNECVGDASCFDLVDFGVSYRFCCEVPKCPDGSTAILSIPDPQHIFYCLLSSSTSCPSGSTCHGVLNSSIYGLCCGQSVTEPECPNGVQPYDDPSAAGYQIFYCDLTGDPDLPQCPQGYTCTNIPGSDSRGICCLKQLCPGGGVLKDPVTYVPLSCPEECGPPSYVCTDIGLEYEVCCKDPPEPPICPDGNYPYDDPAVAGYQIFTCDPNVVQSKCPQGYSCIPISSDKGICCLKELCPGGGVLKDPVTHVPLMCPSECGPPSYFCTDIGLEYEVCCKQKEYECPYTGLPPQLDSSNVPLPCPDKCKEPSFCADVGLDYKVCCPAPLCPNGDIPLSNPAFIDDYFMYSCDRPGCPPGYDCIPQSVWDASRRTENAICCPKADCETCELETSYGFVKEYNAEQCCFYWGVNASCSGCCKSSFTLGTWVVGQSVKPNKDCECCLPSGRYDYHKTWKICLHGPELDPNDACNLPGLQNLPPWFTCETIVYQIPTDCYCQDCEKDVSSTGGVVPDIDLVAFDAQPASDLVSNYADSFIQEEKEHYKDFLKALKAEARGG